MSHNFIGYAIACALPVFIAGDVTVSYGLYRYIEWLGLGDGVALFFAVISGVGAVVAVVLFCCWGDIMTTPESEGGG